MFSSQRFHRSDLSYFDLAGYDLHKRLHDDTAAFRASPPHSLVKPTSLSKPPKEAQLPKCSCASNPLSDTPAGLHEPLQHALALLQRRVLGIEHLDCLAGHARGVGGRLDRSVEGVEDL